MAPVSPTGLPAPPARSRFRRRLLAWYGRHRRDLPWRRTEDPYRILVSEIMLQQTQVDRVIPKYHEFLDRYPTLQSLAGSTPEEVARLWYPLGYNIRPINLRGIACEAVASYGGRLPDDDALLRGMRGIGRYTAGAVRCFAYGRAVPIVDTNVRRVLGRVFEAAGFEPLRTDEPEVAYDPANLFVARVGSRVPPARRAAFTSRLVRRHAMP